jgi:hypothetical protein
MKISATAFARLTELINKGNALTEDERTEKAAIEAQIVAADEEGETGGEGEGEKEKEEEETGGEGGGETQPEPAADPAPAPESDDADLQAQGFEKLTIGAKIKALVAVKAGLQAKLSAATGQLAALGSQLTAANARATAAESALAEATANLAASQARVAALEAESKDLHAAVTDELAGLGVKAGDLVPVEASGQEGTPGSEAELEERLKECQTHGERMTLIKAFKAKQAAAAKRSAA